MTKGEPNHSSSDENHRILHIITSLNAGGAERALYNILAGGVARHFDNAVISLGDEGVYGPQLKELGIPVWSLNMGRSMPSFRALRYLGRLVREFRPQVLQGWMYHGNLAAAVAPCFAWHQVPVVWNIRHSIYNLAKEKRGTRAVIWSNRLLSARPRKIIYNSTLSRHQHETFGLNPARGQVIPNGFDLNRWQPSALKRSAVRQELEIPDGAPLIGHVARYHPMKDHANYLQALKAVALKYPDVHFLLIGREVNAFNPVLEPFFSDLSQGRVHTLGERSDIEHLMPALDILCLSSAWGEGFPNVLGEAMACGVPCVSTDVGDSTWIIGDTGVSTPPEDPRALAQGLEKLLSMNVEERSKLGSMARQRIAKHFSLGSAVDMYTGLYKKILKRNRRN